MKGWGEVDLGVGGWGGSRWSERGESEGAGGGRTKGEVGFSALRDAESSNTREFSSCSLLRRGEEYKEKKPKGASRRCSAQLLKANYINVLVFVDKNNNIFVILVWYILFRRTLDVWLSARQLIIITTLWQNGLFCQFIKHEASEPSCY